MKLLKYFLMAKVQAIEIADGENAILMFFSAVVQAADNLHVFKGVRFFKALYPTSFCHGEE